MSMVVSVTPLSVAPLALPGPHTALRLAKSPGPAAAAADVVVTPPPGEVTAVLLLLRLQAPANRPTTATITSQRQCFTTLPPDWCNR
jgi:hypothetical protein